MEKAKKIILIVDDSALIVDRLISLLETTTTDHMVLTSGTYQQALETINAKDPDIAILDIQLPDGSGIELLRYIKEHKPAIPAIMFTNQATEMYHQLCMREGAAYFIDKSSGFDSLSGIIASLLEKK